MLEIFDAYPEKRRGSMAEAEEVFGKSVWSDDDLRTAYRNLEAWKLSEQWTKENGRFIPFLRNWIERGEWKIQPDKQTQGRRELDEYEIEAIRRLMEEEP